MNKAQFRSKVDRLDAMLSKLYEVALGKGMDADDQFWNDINALDKAFGGKIKPESEMVDVNNACSAFYGGFRLACELGIKRAKQARADAAKGRPRAG